MPEGKRKKITIKQKDKAELRAHERKMKRNRNQKLHSKSAYLGDALVQKRTPHLSILRLRNHAWITFDERGKINENEEERGLDKTKIYSETDELSNRHQFLKNRNKLCRSR